MTSNTKQDTSMKVKSKERVNQSGSTRRWGCISEFLLVTRVRLVTGVWASPRKAYSTTHMPHPILRWTPPQRPSSSSTIGILEGAIRCLYKLAWGTHTHNQIGGSQTHHESVTTNNTQVKIKQPRFLHKETLGEKSLKWMRGKWRTAWWRCRSGGSPSVLQRSSSLVVGIGRYDGIGELLKVDLEECL